MKNYLKFLGLGMALFSFLFFAISFDNICVLLKKPVELYAEDTSFSELKEGDYVYAEVFALLDCYAADDWYTRDDDTITYTDHNFYYLIPVFNASEPDVSYYISIKAHEEQKSAFNSVVNDTQDFLMGVESDYGKSVITGNYRIAAADPELYDFMKDYFRELGLDDTTISKYVLPYNLIPVNNNNAIGVIIGAVLLVVGLLLFITMSFSIKKEKKKIKEQVEVVINGVSYPKSTFDHMFQDALRQNTRAVSELCRITGVSEEEAKKILRHWDKYYYY